MVTAGMTTPTKLRLRTYTLVKTGVIMPWVYRMHMQHARCKLGLLRPGGYLEPDCS